jgi:hypothetical protein
MPSRTDGTAASLPPLSHLKLRHREKLFQEILVLIGQAI